MSDYSDKPVYKMPLMAMMRNHLFWMIDHLHGGGISQDVNDIRRIMEGDFALVREKQETRLKAILEYATQKIPFYQKYRECKQLDDFPVVNKGLIRDDISQFMNNEFERDKLFVQGTSGSTGAPFEVFWDSGKRRRATADTLYFSQLAHYEVGSRLYFSRVWEHGSERSKLTCLKQNWVVHDSRNLNDESLETFVRQLQEDSSPKNVILFASTLSSIAKYLERNKLNPDCKIISFITLSESLDDITKAVIEKRMNTRVYSRYSNQELGIMAQHFDGSNEFRVNEASFHIELLDLDSDKPVVDGVPGRIVVTDYFNHAMPLVRYDTGDVAVARHENDQLIFKRVDGRRVDCIFDTKGRMVSPYVINTPMHEFLEIQQYQFIQNEANDYEMLLNLKDKGNFQREQDMLSMLREYLGDDANIKVRYVDEIPVLKSGKRKQVVNNYKR